MNQRSVNLLGGHDIFEEITSLDNLFLAWKEFKKGKTSKPDVQEFEFNLEDNLFQIHEELKSKKYKHGNYVSFYVRDPKLRHIHKSTAKDRIVHHAIFRVLYSIFDKGFIHDSYSCRLSKGTHIAVSRLDIFVRKLSKNNRKTVYVLRCDVRKFFDSVDKATLLKIIKDKISDKNSIWLVSKILDSFSKSSGKGLPLGNVTSQLFANIYLNELDQFIKHTLKAKYYLRYCDDFVILGYEPSYLLELSHKIGEFLEGCLCLKLNEDKVILKKHRQGIDFLGYIVLPHHRLIRTKTRKRAVRKIIEKRNEFDAGLITEDSFKQSLSSYLGILKHCNGYNLENEVVWLSGLVDIEI